MGYTDERMSTRAFRGWSFLLSSFILCGDRKMLGITDDTKSEFMGGSMGNTKETKCNLVGLGYVLLRASNNNASPFI